MEGVDKILDVKGCNPQYKPEEETYICWTRRITSVTNPSRVLSCILGWFPETTSSSLLIGWRGFGPHLIAHMGLAKTQFRNLAESVILLIHTSGEGSSLSPTLTLTWTEIHLVASQHLRILLCSPIPYTSSTSNEDRKNTHYVSTGHQHTDLGPKYLGKSRYFPQ